MNSVSLPFRQVHLDFHTAEQIGDVGQDFSKAQFQEMLQLGCVESINLFARCHHGYSYHPTKVGVMHPALSFDLLAEQMQACAEIGVIANIYITVGWDEYWANTHPEHVVLPPASDIDQESDIYWQRLKFEDQYLTFLCDYIEEVIVNYDPAGLWLDIIGYAPSVAEIDQQRMRALSLNPESEADRKRYARIEQEKYLERISAHARQLKPGIGLFHNAGHIYKGMRNFAQYISHYELESLPTGGWGYDHYPLSAKYVAALNDGKDFLGMTGKFHSTWGEFGGFKHPNALRYECALMLAFGGRCSIGDQLHPRGLMNKDTYQRIGLAYAEVAEKQAYCIDTKPVSDIAILSIEALENAKQDSTWLWIWGEEGFTSDSGVGRMLLESQLMFDVIDADADFSNYKVIIIPDHGRLNKQQANKLQNFLDAGGKLVLSYQSGMHLDQQSFHFNLGEVDGQSEFDPEYIQISTGLVNQQKSDTLVTTPFVIPGHSMQVQPAGAVVLADSYQPYFNRTPEQFCSHQHTPESEKSQYPAAFIANDNILYFSHAIFSAYDQRGQMLYRDLFYAAFAQFSELSASTNLPSCGRISLLEQASEQRYVFHLLYAQPIKRGGQGDKSVEVIEDVLPVYEVECSLILKNRPCRVFLPLSGAALPFDITEEKQGYGLQFRVPKLDLHEIVLIDY